MNEQTPCCVPKNQPQKLRNIDVLTSLSTTALAGFIADIRSCCNQVGYYSEPDISCCKAAYCPFADGLKDIKDCNAEHIKSWLEKEIEIINRIPHTIRSEISETLDSTGWIPCNEMLPESSEDVLVWFEYFRYGEYNCMYQTYNIGNYFPNYGDWMVGHETGWQKLKVLAWMPLPEPPESKVQE